MTEPESGTPAHAPDTGEIEAVADRLHQAAEELLASSAEDDLVSGEVRARVAGVDEENPFGRRGRPFGTSSLVRTGFALAVGVMLALALGQAVLAVRSVLVLVLVSAFLAIGLDPVVSVLDRTMRRGYAVAIVAMAFLLFLGGVVIAVVPPVTDQVSQLVDNGPGLLDDLSTNRTVRDLDRRFHFIEPIRSHLQALPQNGVRTMGGVLGAGAAVLGALVSTLTVLTLTLYLLANLPGIKRYCYLLVPRSRRARVSLLTDEILARVGGYVLGNLATSVVAGLVTLVLLELLSVPYAVALALVIALFDLVPLVGATIGAAVVTLVAFLAAGTQEGLAVLVFFLIYQQVENFLLVPRIMKRAVDVSPLVTILAALLGAALLGVFGALLAIPVAAAVQLVLREVLIPRQDET